MSKKVKKVMVIDSQWYLGADQVHLITQLRKIFPEAPIYFAVNTKADYWRKGGEKLRSLWERRGVHLEEAEKIEINMIDKLASKHEAKKVVIGSNDRKMSTFGIHRLGWLMVRT
jgi:ABC-type enterochelin transport system substrate-binding protein